MDPFPQPGADTPTDPSPTNTRRPSRSEAVAHHDDRSQDILQPADTVRRRLEGGYQNSNGFAADMEPPWRH